MSDGRPLTPTLGAEVIGLDLAEHLDDHAVMVEVHRAFPTCTPRGEGATSTTPRGARSATRSRPLRIDRAFTTRIGQLSERESDALLQLLFHHVANDPTLHCRVRWEPGTLTFWDNRRCQHFAVWDYWPEVREGERVTIAGTAAPAAFG